MELAQAAETCSATGALSSVICRGWFNESCNVKGISLDLLGPFQLFCERKGWIVGCCLIGFDSLLFTGASSCSVPNTLQTSLRTVLCDIQKKRSQLARSRSFFKRTCEHSSFPPIASNVCLNGIHILKNGSFCVSALVYAHT